MQLKKFSGKYFLYNDVVFVKNKELNTCIKSDTSLYIVGKNYYIEVFKNVTPLKVDISFQECAMLSHLSVGDKFRTDGSTVKTKVHVYGSDELYYMTNDNSWVYKVSDLEVIPCE